MKRYVGQLNRDGLLAVPLRHLVCHSPSGFCAGYGGSGPADLALALASDVIDEERETVSIGPGRVAGRRAWDVHQGLKWALVAGLSRNGFELDAERVVAAITRLEAERGGLPSGPTI